MKFTIVSTFYNNTIEEVEALKNSILAQTYTKWEWIISDDFSKEKTDHIGFLKKLPSIDKRIKYIEQKSKKEIFWNPQTYATGDVIILIGADDTIFPRTLEIYNYHFVKYPDCLFITSEANIYKPIMSYSSFIEYNQYSTMFDKRHLFPLAGWLNMGVPLAWRNIPIDFTEGFELTNREIINDYLIHTRLEELGKFIHLPRVFYNYNIREDSVCRKIDEDNSHKAHSSEKVNQIITKRRGNRELDSLIDLYNGVTQESNVFYYSELNLETTCQEVSVITTYNMNVHKRSKLKQLYVDHNIYFNVFNDSIDYYLIYIDKDSNLDILLDQWARIKNPKQVLLLSQNNREIFDKMRQVVNEYFWFAIDWMFLIKKDYR